MKKINLLTIAIIFATAMSSFAQTSKGTLFIGGGLGFTSKSEKEKTSSSTTDGDKIFSYSINPGVGYFISDKLALGLDFGFTGENSTSTQNIIVPVEVELKTTLFNITPYARYYWMVGDNFGFTGTLGVGIGSGTTKTTITNTTNTTSKISTLEVGFRPGIVFFPTNKVGLEANFGFVGFSSLTDKDPNNSSNKTITSEFGLGANSITPELSLGFRYYLTK
ncbi:MAG: porin family protein [Raineya sp.]|jgi:hypothetical protein|nr:porin family protein [Raineya sp.]